MIGAAYSVPASLFRVYGGHLSDRYGARRVMYWTFGVSVAAPSCCPIRRPTTWCRASAGRSRSIWRPASCLHRDVFVLGFFMSLGKAAVFKHIPVYYPQERRRRRRSRRHDRRARRLRAADRVRRAQRSHRRLDELLHAAVRPGLGVALLWMHLRSARWSAASSARRSRSFPSFRRCRRSTSPSTSARCRRAVLAGLAAGGQGVLGATAAPSPGATCGSRSRRCCCRSPCGRCGRSSSPSCRRSVSTSRPISCSGSRRCPGISGAMLRIFYSFMVPIFGGRLWTTVATWSLIIPAVGIGYAVQNPSTPYVCSWCWRCCAASAAAISPPRWRTSRSSSRRRRRATRSRSTPVSAISASASCSSWCRSSITAGVFGWLGGEPVTVRRERGRAPLWLQNAGFVWVPFIAASAFAAWFGMNDIASAKASFAEQAVIFQRKHNWLMCWLYTGTFGSFIGYSAGFPLLAKTQFPEVNALPFVFLGPLVGALSRSATGWVSDKYGGGRVTFWVFVVHADRRRRRPLLPRHQGSARRVLGLLRDVPRPVLRSRRRQCVHLPDDTEHHAQGDRPADAGVSMSATRMRQAEKESAAIIGFTSAIAAFGAFFIPKATARRSA